MSTSSNQRILVGVCTYDSIAPQTCASLLSYYKNCRYPCQIRIKPYTYIHVARNSLVLDAVEQNATHLMFIDSDIVFPTEAVDRLVEQDKDIIGGLYRKRISPHNPVIFRKVGDRLKNIIPPYEGKKIFEVDTIGAGFLLIKMEALKKMNPPFFYYGMPSEFGLKDSQIFDLGEDTTFCLKARQNGFKIWCDPTIQIGHIGIEIF